MHVVSILFNDKALLRKEKKSLLLFFLRILPYISKKIFWERPRAIFLKKRNKHSWLVIDMDQIIRDKYD